MMKVSKMFEDEGLRKRFSFVSIRTMNKLLVDDMNVLEDEISKRMGVYMDEYDNDELTRLVKASIRSTRNLYRKLDPASKPKNILIRTARRIPLPLPDILPLQVVKERRNLSGFINYTTPEVQATTAKRDKYIDITSYAFRTEEPIFNSSSGSSAPCNWGPQFHLLATTESKKTWRDTLEYSERDFEEWWTGKRQSNPNGSKAWLDLRTLSRCVVFILDDINSDNMEAFPSYPRLLDLATQAKYIVLELALLHSRHPDQDYGTSKLFGFLTPIVYTLWKTMKRVRRFNSDPSAIKSLACNALSLAFTELENLMNEMQDIVSNFGGLLLADPHISTTREEAEQLSYAPKPTTAELVDFGPTGLSDEAKSMIINSRLVTNESDLEKAYANIRRIEHSKADEILAANPPARKTYNFDFEALEENGVKKLNVQPSVVSVLGSGSHSIVASYRSEEGSEVYAVKSYSNKSSLGGNIIRREYSIWSRLNHNNILPLLGYCILPGDPFPSLVTRICLGNSLHLFLKHHHVSERKKLEFLRDIASALSYMHFLDIAHGDLRAANILVHNAADDQDTHALICDFGASDVLSGVRTYVQSSEQKTRDNWLAPELLFSNEQVKARVSKEGDMYAYGCVILEVAFKKSPYESHPPELVIDAKQRGELPAKRVEMDGMYWPISRNCWNYDTDKRATSNWVLSQLENLLHTEE